jgi:site-specific recombinase XerD
VIAPPCLKCGSLERYFTNGLCARCHQFGGPQLDSCTDCFAWGATRHRSWRCIGCDSWRRNQRRPVGACCSCRRDEMPLAPDGGCRLCRKQRTRVLAAKPWPLPDVIDANRFGQQLFFADMFILNGLRTGRRGPRPKAPPAPEVALPVGHRQEQLFAVAPDLGRLGPVEVVLDRQLVIDALARRVDAHALRYGWTKSHTSATRGAMRVLVTLQATPGAVIRASEVVPLAQLHYSVPAVIAVLAEAGMLEDDREPAVVCWFRSQVADLPEPMRDELGVWFDVMRNGSSTPPRRLPRKDTTTVGQLRTALPVLRHWARTHDTLREVSRDDIKAVLPASGWQRSQLLGALRSIFRVLKDARLVFTNPTTHMHARQPDYGTPAPIDLDKLRAAIGAHDPARAAVAALLAFHAVQVKTLRTMQLTDVHDGRLHLDGRTVLLAEPARDCLAAYLDHRNRCWPNTINPHLFINRRTATHTRPVNDNWIRDTLGMAPQAVRRDRILDEAFATAGDLRQLTDLFGLHVSTADRYATIANRARTADPPAP